MVEKKKKTKENTETKSSEPAYTMSEVFKISDDFFQLQKNKHYPIGAFIHALLFALELTEKSYRIPPQQLAEIKRHCRRYVNEIIRTESQKKNI